MNSLDNIQESKVSFSDFLFKTKRNRIVLLLIAISVIVQFSIFKYLYPFPSFIHNDSWIYLRIAYYNFDIDFYMIGYGRFLRLFSAITSSDLVLTCFQYLSIQCSALFFLFTLFYFYNPNRSTQIVLLCFIVFNPLFLHLGNLISSDGLFLALSMFWFTLLIWIIHKPSTQLIILQAITLFFAFTVRYNALIYPLISVITLLIYVRSKRDKIIGISTSLLLCGLFIIYTGNKYKALTGIWQYSPFSGWQMANNAMYTYRYVSSNERKAVPEKFRELDNMIRTYFDSTRDVKKYPYEALLASTAYMWTEELPLRKYMHMKFKKNDKASEVKNWASMGPFLYEYGSLIIKQYPIQFAKHFLWPNASRYYSPPVEFLGGYNMGIRTVDPIVQAWFGLNSLRVTTRTKDFNVTILDYYPILTGIMNVVFLCSLICFLLINGFRSKLKYKKGLLLGSCIWFLNASFTISASSAALRFQAFPILLVTTLALLTVDALWKMAKNQIINETTSDDKTSNKDSFLSNNLELGLTSLQK